MRVRLSDEERKIRKSERGKRYYAANREKSLEHSRLYYQNVTRDKLKASRERRKLRSMMKRGIEIYVAAMIRYYTKEHRQRCYKQLKEDFQNMQRHLQVA